MKTFEEIKFEEIKARVIKFKGNTQKAARSLRIGRATIYRTLGALTIADIRKEAQKSLDNSNEIA